MPENERAIPIKLWEEKSLSLRIVYLSCYSWVKAIEITSYQTYHPWTNKAQNTT